MLLDEPFGALDALTRAAMQEWLLGGGRRLRATFILVTHDVDEAVLLADRVYVLSPRPGAHRRHGGCGPAPRPRPSTASETRASLPLPRDAAGCWRAARWAPGRPGR